GSAASPEVPVAKDGFAAEVSSSGQYRTIFMECDAIVLPGENAKAVFSVGAFRGFTKSQVIDIHGTRDYSADDKGISLRVRAMIHGNENWDLTPFVAYRYSDKKISSITGGLMFNFGHKMMVKHTVEK